MRELRVEDALLYLDQVKVEFGDRPHIYNEFLDIMKTFKTQQIDTPGVIRRVSNLFQGNRRLVLGFNTFLPEGYRIELPDGDGPPVAVFRAPGEMTVRHDLSGPNIAPIREIVAMPEPASKPTGLPSGPTGLQVAPGQTQTTSRFVGPAFEGMMLGRGGGPGGMPGRPPPPPSQQQPPPPPQQLHHRVTGPPGIPPSQPPLLAHQVGEPAGELHHPHTVKSRPLDASSVARAGLPPQPGRPGLPVGQPQPQPQPQPQRTQPIAGRQESLGSSNNDASPPSAPNGAGNPQQSGQPLEFDHAIKYVTNIKKRFADEPETYKKFLEILHTYQKEQRGIKEVLEEVSVLFEEHPDLLKEFTFFLPDAVQSEAKQQLEIVVKEAEDRRTQKLIRAKEAAQPIKQTKRHVAPTPPPPTPVEIRTPSASLAFGATAPRSVEREKEIHRSTVYGTVSFGPPRPPRKNMPTVAEAAKKEGRPTVLPPCPPQPTTSEMAFFERAKRHLGRRELAPDKPTGRARHTPYAEFLKCLHLFGSGVLAKDELKLLLRGLFVQGHAPKSGVNAGGGASNPAIATDAANLLKEFNEIIIGRGPYAEQLVNRKDKSKYGAKRCRDMELANKASPSYAEYPKDYPSSDFLAHTGQTEEDAHVLNNTLVSVPKDKTPMCSIKTRRNAYEEAMFRIEDERFEVDMAVERNALAMRKTEPIAEEVQMLREGEEKDGQPIGRLQYKLNPRTLNSIQINSIGRIYGENGDEVIQYLARNPLAVLPIIYQRLRQKDSEWRKQKSELMSQWKAATEANYEGSLDHTCYFKRHALERSFGLEQLRDECKQARQYCSNQNKRNDSPVSFGLSVPDKSAVFYQPYASVEMKPSSSVHHDAVSFLIKHIAYRCTPNPDARGKVGRIWTEFMLPFFGYPSYWVLEESRQSYQGKISNAIVQYAVGERVMTAFGEGTIQAFVDGIDSEEGPRYRVKLPFGVGYLQPYAILHNVDAKDGSKYIRRDDEMMLDSNSSKLTSEGSEASSSVVVDQKFKLLFGSDSIYLFLRLYGFLICLLDDIKEYLERNATMFDPSQSYYNPIKSADDRERIDRKLNFASITAKLGDVIAKKAYRKDLETFARRVNRDITYKIAALPKLVERCGDMMIKMSEEDLLPGIFDTCQYSGQCPVTLRSTCMAMSSTAEYRIQYNTKLGRIYFSYLPEDEELSTTLPGDDDDDDDDDDEMEDGEMDDDYDDDMDLDHEEEDLREVKRMKVR